MIYRSRSLLLLLAAALELALADYVTHPDINFDPLQQLAISGSYSGISLYKDTRQLTTITKSTSSAIALSNDTLQLLGSTNINGAIYDACIYNTDTLILAGNFTTVNGQKTNNIVSIELNGNNVKAMKQGLDGPVYSVYCDTDAVYVGGSFIAPSNSDMVEYSNSLSQFGGNIAIWKNNQWMGVPWKGLNGPVNSIVKNKNKQMIFGGKFDTTTDGQTLHAPASQPISIPASGVSATSGANPSSILCAPSSSSNSWLLSDGVTGTWQANFINYQVNPSLIRIVNSKVENHQTKDFSIRSLTAGSTNYTLSYLDPVTGVAKICSNNCTLSNDPAVTYQDFRVLNTSMTSGIAIDIKSWYGVSGGLSSVKVFQSEIFTYAVYPDPTNICASDSTLPKVVQSGGNWTSSADKTSPYLTYNVKSKSDKAAVTFYPHIAESGIYELLIYTPQCESSGCSDRTDIDITISTTPSTKANVTMSQKYPGSKSVYTGYFDVTSSFDPSVRFDLANNASITSSSQMVAFAVQLVKASTNYALSSMLQYNTTQTNITMTNLAWGALSDNLPYKSEVKTIKLMDNGDMFIGGNFSGTDTFNAKYNNIVQFDSSANKLRALTGGGLDNVVQSIDATSNELFVGGNFTGTSSASNTSKSLTNVVRYNIKSSTWNSLDGGLNGAVKSVNVLSSNSVLISGNFDLLRKTGKDGYSTKVSGNAWWDAQKQQWIVDSSVPFLSGVVHTAFVNKNTEYYIGNVNGAQRYQSNGLSYLTSSDTLNFPSFYPDGSKSSVSVSSGVLFNGNSGVTSTPKSATSNETTAIFGGAFNLPNNIRNIAIYSNNAWSGVQGADWNEGQISTMAVNDDLLYVGGRFTGSTSNNLAVFSLSNKSLSLNPNVKTNDGSPANVNIIRHVPTQNSMVVGGNFSAVGSLACSSVCAFNTGSLQWNSLGSGLVGEVYDMVMINNKLVTSGNMTLNNSPLPIAQFDFDKNSWGPFATAELPGPSRAISYDNITNYLYISGQMQNSSDSYLRIWNGQQFDAPAHELGPGSFISKLSMLPLKNASSSQNILLASGFINLGELGNVSAAFYDGKSWIPYLVTSNSNGETATSLSSLFFLDQPYIKAVIKNFLPTPLVILVAIAISLGIVFSIVLCAMIIIYVKRKRDSKVNPQTNPSAYYGKPPRTPQSLLAVLKDTSPDDNGDTNYKNSMEKNHYLEPETQQFYNMSKSISTDLLHEQQLTPFNDTSAMTTARAAPNPPTTHSRSVPQSNNNFSSYAFNNVAPAAAAAAALEASRPDSYVRPVSEYHRDTESFYYNNNNSTNYDGGSGREMSEVPGRKDSYNPFRNSGAGLAIGGAGAALAVAGAAQNNYNNSSNNAYTSSQHQGSPTNNYNNYYNSSAYTAQSLTPLPQNNQYDMRNVGNNSSVPESQPAYTMQNTNPFPSHVQQRQGVSYGNIPPANVSTAGVVPDATTAAIGGAAIGAAFAKDRKTASSKNQEGSANHGNSNPHIGNNNSGTVKWTTTSSEPASRAVVKPVSLVGTSDESSLVDPISGPQTTRSKASNDTPTPGERVLWTSTTSDKDALATAVVTNASTPSIAIHSSTDQETSSTNNYQNNSSVSLNNQPAKSNVQWTNNDTRNALGVATVEQSGFRESGYHDHGSFYSPTPVNIASSSNHSLSDIVSTTSNGFSSDPDIARWTTAPAPVKSSAKIDSVVDTDDNVPTDSSRGHYKPSLTPHTWEHDMDNQSEDRLSPHAAEAHIHADIAATAGASLDKYDVNTKVMHKNAFRLSDAASLPPIDTTPYSDTKSGKDQDSLLSPDSAVRWKTANVGSPIETAFASHILEPATATITRRSDNAEGAFENDYNLKSQKSAITPIPSTSTTSTKTKKKYKPVANANLNQTEPDNEPIGRKSETVDEAISNRDLDALSMIIQEEQKMPVNPLQKQTPAIVPTNSRSTPSPAAGIGAMDGRAASKRLVEEYLSSRNNKTEEAKDKKSKYKSDFKSVMESAILNNTKSAIATEDQPHLYYAKFDFSAREHGELGFEKADPIIVVDSSDDIWWMGYKADKSDGSYIQGVFPSNYVEIATELRT